MSFAPRPPSVAESSTRIAAYARLDLTEDRRAVVAEALDQAVAVIDVLDELDLDDVAPATAFDARWQ